MGSPSRSVPLRTKLWCCWKHTMMRLFFSLNSWPITLIWINAKAGGNDPPDGLDRAWKFILVLYSLCVCVLYCLKIPVFFSVRLFFTRKWEPSDNSKITIVNKSKRVNCSWPKTSLWTIYDNGCVDKSGTMGRNSLDYSLYYVRDSRNTWGYHMTFS